MSRDGYFGEYGGCYVPETLVEPLRQLQEAFYSIVHTKAFQTVYQDYLKHYVGRETPLYHAKRFSDVLDGAAIYLKREDLTHTGAHKINNTIGQALLARFMGKKCLIAETGAGQHGVATATVASLLGLSCIVFMGEKDIERQHLNVVRMKILGAEVHPVRLGSKTLKDATSEALRYWVSHLNDAYYLLGSALGPHPYPTIVREFQRVIGIEAKKQMLAQVRRLPDELIACVGGGSNAIGLFYAFLNDSTVRMTGVEAGGTSFSSGCHAARFKTGRKGVLQGSLSYLLQDEDGQVLPTSSISAGLDYPSVGPEHAFLHDTKRVQYTAVHDKDALNAALLLARVEGIIPALESAHALAYAIERAKALNNKDILLVGISGRGDKDVETISQYLGEVHV